MGFFSIPLDLISEWRNRPQNKSQKEIMARKIELQEKLADLLPRGLQIEGITIGELSISNFIEQSLKKKLKTQEVSLPREVPKQM